MAELDSFEESPGTASPRGEIHLADYWAIVVKRRRLIVICLAAALVAGMLATVLTRPKYTAKTVLDVERQASSPVSFAPSQADGGSSSEFLPSQIQLMQSREIAERVVRRLNLLADPQFNPKHYARFRPDAKGNVPQPAETEVIGAALAVKRWVEVTIMRGTSLVEIAATAPSPELAAAIPNAVADSYIDWNIESRFKLIGQSSQFLASQIEQGKAEIDVKERELLAYGRQKDIVSVDASTNPALQKLESVNRDLAAAVADRVAREARYEELRSAPPETLAESSSSVVGALRVELQRLEREYSEKSNVYKPEWPAMQQLKAQIEEGRQNLQVAIREGAAKTVQAARSEYLTALRREQSLRTMTRTEQSAALAQGSSAVEYKNLRVEIDTKRALLDNLLRQQGETEVISRLREDQLTSIRIVDRALEPGGPFEPSLEKNLLVALFLGGALGVGLAFFLSYLDRTLRTAEQVERLIQLPPLGVIPARADFPAPGAARARIFRGVGKTVAPPEDGENVENAIELAPHEEPRSPIAEAYRAFRTALLLSRAGGVKCVVLTSALPHEGKTTTAVNLAVVLGQLGRRVLLVDADLHQSRLHEIFRIPNRVGLVSILAEGIEPSRAIVKTAIPGVFVVPAGPDAPNPSGLLASDAMRKFLELASTNFDHVVVDSPPVLPVSDTLVFAQQTDGVVLCVRGGVTPREHVIRARDRILRSGVPIVGVLINALAPDSTTYYRYEYGYGYPREGKSEVAGEPAAPRVVHTT
ncbi:MAG: polysaccharide biosynthesis tyrosine autokinase [Thermoanaerobaculia bacterium]